MNGLPQGMPMSAGPDPFAQPSANERVHSEAAKAALRQAAVMFIQTLHMIGGTAGDRFGSAQLTLAARAVEEAEHRALRHLGAFN